MAAVLIPVWTPGASLLEIAFYGLLSLPAYAAICLLTGRVALVGCKTGLASHCAPHAAAH